MLSRFEREKQQILPYVQSNIATWRGQDLGVLAQNINHFVNQKTYTTDQKLWGKSDYWETPVEFFKRGGGDCEDFAITKYMLLRMMNVPKERLRIAIVNDTEKGIHHAILIVYTDQGSMFLDNQIKQATYTRASTRYEPIFSINEQSWWLHEQERNQGTMVASR
jgi:predicted transglutaminase-like cysteine proteinase